MAFFCILHIILNENQLKIEMTVMILSHKIVINKGKKMGEREKMEK